MPNRGSSSCPHEHTRRRNCHDARRPASSSKQQVSNSPDSKRPSRAFVVAVLGSWAKYYLPPASGSKVARYRGSRCPVSVQCQVDCHRHTGTIPRPRQKRIAIWTQGIIPEHTLITFGNLDVDIALEPRHIAHRPDGVAGRCIRSLYLPAAADGWCGADAAAAVRYKPFPAGFETGSVRRGRGRGPS